MRNQQADKFADRFVPRLPKNSLAGFAFAFLICAVALAFIGCGNKRKSYMEWSEVSSRASYPVRLMEASVAVGPPKGDLAIFLDVVDATGKNLFVIIPEADTNQIAIAKGLIQQKEYDLVKVFPPKK